MHEFTRAAMVDQRGRLPSDGTHGGADLAGSSFKHEHLAAILEEGLNGGFFAVHDEK